MHFGRWVQFQTSLIELFEIIINQDDLVVAEVFEIGGICEPKAWSSSGYYNDPLSVFLLDTTFHILSLVA